MRQDDSYEIIHDPDERVEDPDTFRPELQLSRHERRWVALGALKAALLIGLVYLAVIALIIWLMLHFWM